MASAAFTPGVPASNEAGLIRQIIRGRKDLFGDLIQPHVKPLLHIIRNKIDSHQDAEDIAQQATLKALKHLEQFRFEASFRTWLLGIGLNEARQWQRKRCTCQRLMERSASVELEPAADSPSPYLHVERAENVKRLRGAVAMLPEKYRSVLILRDFEELSIAEVASRLALTISAVKTRHQRARLKVAQLLNEPKPSRAPKRCAA